MGDPIPNILQLGFFEWFEKTQEPLVKQLAVPMHFLRCGSLLDDCRVVLTAGLLSAQFSKIYCTKKITYDCDLLLLLLLPPYQQQHQINVH
ncbi:hypothetical protein TNCV_3056851 [Trichonephila clavipes]|nr:hypothetical protein TNCV_3056851 [Trichonephila clavipes]